MLPQNETQEKLAPHPPLATFYRSPSDRPQFVQELFDRSARHYDWLSAAMSLGTDRQYRKITLRRAGLRGGMKLLDVATGTGLMAQAALDLGVSPRDLVGLDPSRGMLQENRKRNPISLLQGLGERLPFRDQVFDFITMSYALRHVEDLGGLFREFHRVLRSGGRVLLLELTRPTSRFGFLAMQFLLRKIVPWLTRLRTREREPVTLMEYYWTTIAECVPPETILSVLAGSGFSDARRQTLGSVLSEYTGVKS